MGPKREVFAQLHKFNTVFRSWLPKHFERRRNEAQTKRDREEAEASRIERFGDAPREWEKEASKESAKDAPAKER